ATDQTGFSELVDVPSQEQHITRGIVQGDVLPDMPDLVSWKDFNKPCGERSGDEHTGSMNTCDHMGGCIEPAPGMFVISGQPFLTMVGNGTGKPAVPPNAHCGERGGRNLFPDVPRCLVHQVVLTPDKKSLGKVEFDSHLEQEKFEG